MIFLGFIYFVPFFTCTNHGTFFPSFFFPLLDPPSQGNLFSKSFLRSKSRRWQKRDFALANLSIKKKKKKFEKSSLQLLVFFFLFYVSSRRLLEQWRTSPTTSGYCLVLVPYLSSTFPPEAWPPRPPSHTVDATFPTPCRSRDAFVARSPLPKNSAPTYPSPDPQAESPYPPRPAPLLREPSSLLYCEKVHSQSKNHWLPSLSAERRNRKKNL